MFIVSPTTVRNTTALETRSTPKRMLGRIAVIPKTGASFRFLLRLIFEVQLLRFLLPLIPFIIAMLIWPHLALPISQAPVVMVMVVGAVEMKLLAVKPTARDALISDDDMARTHDALRFNSQRILTRLAARRQQMDGDLLLVVEQSELARVPPLTLVSIQVPGPRPEVLALSKEERAIIASELFDDQLTERNLHLAGLREDENLHSVALDASTVSAHARMAALIENEPAPIPSPA